MKTKKEIVLTDASKGIYVENFFIRAAELGLSPKEEWSIHKKRLKGGRQDGVDIIEVDNGALSFTVIPTRGLNILKANYQGMDLGWKSPVEQIVHPALINLEARGGLGWLEGFNEWLARCGLESFGAPGADTIIDNQGNKKDITLTLHGKICNIPASRCGIRIAKERPSRLIVWGELHEASMFGPNLKLTTSCRQQFCSGQI